MFNGEASSSARNVIRSSSISGEMYNLEKGNSGTPEVAGTTTTKKRRSSLGAKMVAIVGLSQWSKSTLQLNQPDGTTKKLRSNIRRSTETGIAVEMRNRVTRQGSRESTDGSTNSNSSDGTHCYLVSENLSEVTADNTPYIKVYLIENGACLSKKKTRTAKKTWDPVYQQVLQFDEGPQGKVLQVIVWGDYGRMDHKCFMGMAQILLEELDLSSCVTGWYKLFPTSSLADSSIAPLTRRLSQSSLESSTSPSCT
ncbi:hypothetical protein AB205_0009540 [Aquarana catesbeiana]|uniref:C2 domain-containing protein n=1 Tax=Aquarana catesbeiana TaxID=8400 RepID=A0A2G9QHI2_AQUCT|nr:hypothetical protein AB205_0009540 [Aquarana catesbeiana]